MCTTIIIVVTISLGLRAINSLCKCSLSLYRSFCVQHFYLFPFSETGFFNLQGTIRNTINLFNVYLIFIHLLATLFKLPFQNTVKQWALTSHIIGICHDKSVIKLCSKSSNWLKEYVNGQFCDSTGSLVFHKFSKWTNNKKKKVMKQGANLYLHSSIS